MGLQVPGILKTIVNGPIIPAVRTIQDFKYAMSNTAAPGVIVLFGDINTVSSLLEQAKQYKKRLILHLDLLEGIGRDKPGINFLARQGVSAVITTKTQIGKMAHEDGMIVIQRLFLMDSEAVRTGIQAAKALKPDAIEVLPGMVPRVVVQRLLSEVGRPILAGGLMQTEEEVIGAINNGVYAVSTSKRELWNFTYPDRGL
ncbi:glycerol-3-phosphate responsive antiterminator [Propionispora vibrioides]|jgi:glycerol uptake operon antiterminator|uniref:Glycerol uptake operon antiterminator n=1 Tax=Propionispora vibrioides TaxID=112903 RepID=A0A1H8RPJ0_9FIRM|nr:glycerol-3-phosphate responsive antiterminator [Propionispora vibrioides]SEO68295.1 glycerol uptake operon antiterminator [Propionispora vibrioides]